MIIPRKFGFAVLSVVALAAAGPFIEFGKELPVTDGPALAINSPAPSDPPVVKRTAPRPAPFAAVPEPKFDADKLTQKPATMAMVMAPSLARQPIRAKDAVLPVDPATATSFSQSPPHPARFVETAEKVPNPALSAFGLPCTPKLKIIAASDDLLAVTFQAACAPNTALTLNSGELSLNFSTDYLGNFSTHIPQLAPNVDVTITDGTKVWTRKEIFLDRPLGSEAYVLVWQGKPPLSLFATSNDPAVRRDSSKYGVIQDQRSPENLVYYAPPPSYRSIRLSLVGTVNGENCGESARARLLQRSTLGIVATDLQFLMPGCDQIGKSLELRRVIPDMKMARK